MITTRYNATAHDLKPLPVGSTVIIQNIKKNSKHWDKSGCIVETLPNRQYCIHVDGSGRITLQNRRFIKPSAILYPNPTTITSTTLTPNQQQQPTPHAPPTSQQTSKIPRALQGLADFNNPGTKDILQPGPRRSLPREEGDEQ